MQRNNAPPGRLQGRRGRLRRLFATTVAVMLCAAMAVPTGTAGAQANLDEFDQALVELINQWRAERGLGILAVHDGLSSTSRDWSDHMASGSTNCASAGTRWGHSALSVNDPAHPSGTTSIAENLAYACGAPGLEADRTWSRAAGPLPGYCTSPIDFTSPESVVCGWLSSTSHRPAIADRQATHIGSGSATRSLGGGGIERWSTQLFTRSTTPEFDVSCDGSFDVVDALLIAQFEVGVRSGVASCALTDTGSQLNVARADVNADGQTNIVDALVIARCVVGLQAC